MSQPNPEHKSQKQENIIKDITVGGDLTFAPQQIETYIKTQIVEISAEKVTQKKLDKSSPYKGLKKFNQRDRKYFFGRDALITELFKAVNNSNFTLVIGASGSGKSSLVRAGLIPEFKKSLQSQELYDFIFTPNQDPFESLYRCLLSEEKDYHFSASDVEFVKQGKSNTLSKLISELNKEKKRSLFFIDQFEQLFIDTDAKQRQNFIAEIVRVAKKEANSIKIILAMRSDFLEQLSFYPTLFALANQNNMHPVTPMHSDELRQAIEQPAAKHGVVFEPGLVEQITKEVEGQSGYLPLLQHTLDLLWEKECTTKSADGRLFIENRVLNRANYTALGGVRGSLQNYVDDIYQNICKENKDGELVTKQIFLKLVNIVESDLGSRAVSRRAYRYEFEGESVKKILQIFIDKNLLVSNYECLSEKEPLSLNSTQHKQNATVEIAHEILLSSWDKLKRWLEEEKEAIILKNWLADETKRWSKVLAENQAKANDELLKGSRLEQIVEFQKENAFEKLGGLSQQEKKLIDASIERKKREEKNRQLTIYSLILVSLIISILAGLATWHSHRSRINEINALSNSAETLLNSNQELEALVTQLKAGKTIKKNIFSIDTKTEIKFLGILQNIFYQIREFNRLEDHNGDVKGVRFSPNSKLIASISSDRTVKLWNLQGKLLSSFPFSSSSVDNLAFSPDGTRILTGDSDGKVNIWSWQGNLIRTFNAHSNTVEYVLYSPDGQTIVSASKDKTIKLWNSEGKLLHTLTGHTASITSLIFSPDGQILASGSYDDTLKLWNLAGELIHSFDKYSEYIKELSFTPNSQNIISISADKNIKIWNIQGQSIAESKLDTDYIDNLLFSNDGRVKDVDTQNKKNIRNQIFKSIFKMPSSISDNVTYDKLNNIMSNSQEKIVISSDGKIVASTNIKDKTIRLWNINGELLHTLTGHTNTIRSIKFSPDGKNLASSSLDRTIKLWDLGGNLLHTMYGHQDHIWDVEFSPDGKILASSSRDKTVKLWNLQQELLPAFKSHTSFVTSVAFSPDGKTIASASVDKTIKLWNLQGKLLSTFYGHNSSVGSVVFSPDGKTIASASADRTIKLWNLKGELISTFKGHRSNILDLAFSPDGKTITSASHDKTIKLWNLQGKILLTLDDHSNTVEGVAFSPDGKMLASASWDNTIKLWNLKGELIVTLGGHTDGVKSVAFSPDGKMLASASDDETVKLWSLQGELIHTFKGHINPVTSAAFSPDGKTIASSSNDSTVKLWNLEGELIFTLKGHNKLVNSVVFSPDGKNLASTSLDKTVQLWSLKLDSLNNVLSHGCNWIGDYLTYNPNVSTADRKICHGVRNNY